MLTSPHAFHAEISLSSPLSCRPHACRPDTPRRQPAPTPPHASQNSPSSFSCFLSIPNVAADPASQRNNADYLFTQLQQRGAEAKLLTAPGLPATVPPVVWGEIKTPGAKRTIVFYAHYDGQPVTPSEWDTAQPFTPVVKQVNGEPRIYARGAGDDKAAIFAQLTALGALQAAHIPLKANIRFVWEGEEEAGSTHLEQILMANRDLIHGDIWLVCDGPVDQTRRQTLIFGARGDAHLQITVYGPNRSLHSGHYGNWAPNPAMMLVQLLAGMKDDDGRVLIPHFYDGIAPLGPIEKEAFAEAPVNDDMLRQELALGHTDGGGKHLLELLNQPSLNINGISSGQTGAHSTNSIPPTATANLDLRLVVGIDWKNQQQRVIDYIRSQGYFITSAPPTREELLAHPKVASSRPTQAKRRPHTHGPAHRHRRHRAIESARGKVILLPTFGGTVPLDAMERRPHPHHHRSHRQPRRQPARRQRKPPPAKPLGRHRNHGRPHRHAINPSPQDCLSRIPL